MSKETESDPIVPEYYWISLFTVNRENKERLDFDKPHYLCFFKTQQIEEKLHAFEVFKALCYAFVECEVILYGHEPCISRAVCTKRAYAAFPENKD